jgi:tetratricopeptide (TPR) repeat protein
MRGNSLIETARVLIPELQQGRVAFLVGAGVSRPLPSGLPIGTELVSCMVDQLAIQAGISEARRFQIVKLVNSRLRPEVIFDVLFAEIGTTSFRPLTSLRHGSPNLIHYFLATMISQGCDVITTNYDVQVERAALNLGMKIPRITSSKAFQRASINPFNSGKLYKLHGSLQINGKLPERTSLVAAMRQVGKGLSESKALVLDKILREKRLVVLGYSGRDEFDIVPKLTTTRNVKHVHWVIHSESKKSEDSNKGAIAQTKKYIHQLLKQIDGPSTMLVCNTLTFVKCLRPKEVRVRPMKVTSSRHHTQFEQSWTDLPAERALILIGDMLRKANAPRAADKAYRDASKRKRDPALNPKIILRRAQATLDLGNINQASPMIEKALTLAKQVKDYPSMVLAYNHLGIIARKQSRWDNAISYYRRALKKAQQFKSDPEDIQNIYNNLGIAFEKKGIYRSALRYLKHGLSLAHTLGDPESVSKSLNNLGIAYDNLREYEDAIESYRESLRLKQLIGYRHGMAQTTHNLALVYEHAGKLDLALSWYAKSLALKKGVTHDKHGIAQTQSNLGRIFRQTGKLNKARVLLHLSIRVLRQVGDNYGFAEASEELAHVEIATGNYLAARNAATDAYKTFFHLKLVRDAGRCRQLLATIPTV